jgi:hypothetical protein
MCDGIQVPDGTWNGNNEKKTTVPSKLSDAGLTYGHVLKQVNYYQVIDLYERCNRCFDLRQECDGEQSCDGCSSR